MSKDNTTESITNISDEIEIINNKNEIEIENKNKPEWTRNNMIFWLIITISSIIISLSAFRYLTFFEEVYPEPLANSFKKEKFFLYLHIFCSMISLLIGPFQFNQKIRKKYINIHRISGKIYGICCIFGGIGSIGLSFRSYGGLVSHFGFCILGLLWIIFTLLSIYFIKYKNNMDDTIIFINIFCSYIKNIFIFYYISK